MWIILVDSFGVVKRLYQEVLYNPGSIPNFTISGINRKFS